MSFCQDCGAVGQFPYCPVCIKIRRVRNNQRKEIEYYNQNLKPAPISCGNCGKLTDEQIDPLNPLCIRCRPTNCTKCKKSCQWSEIDNGYCTECETAHRMLVLYKRLIYSKHGIEGYTRFIELAEIYGPMIARHMLRVEYSLPCINGSNGCMNRVRLSDKTAECRKCAGCLD